MFGIGYTCFLGRTCTGAPMYIAFPRLPPSANSSARSDQITKAGTIAASVLIRGLFTRAGGMIQTSSCNQLTARYLGKLAQPPSAYHTYLLLDSYLAWSQASLGPTLLVTLRRTATWTTPTCTRRRRSEDLAHSGCWARSHWVRPPRSSWTRAGSMQRLRRRVSTLRLSDGCAL